jgi:hypothetical protein
VTYLVPIPGQQQHDKHMQWLHKIAREAGDAPPVLNPAFAAGPGGRGYVAVAYVGKLTYEAVKASIAANRAETASPPLPPAPEVEGLVVIGKTTSDEETEIEAREAELLAEETAEALAAEELAADEDSTAPISETPVIDEPDKKTRSGRKRK